MMSDPHVIKPGRYRHFKGNEYDVIGVARDSETLQALVVYRALYGERGLWVRPLEMFTEVIEREGQRLPRFSYVGER
jgi:cyclomaltodextrinase